MILHLGVADIPYAHELAPDVGKRDKVPGGTQTTGDVATWLEDKYRVMEVFFQEHGGDVAKSLEGSLAGALESLLMGAPASLDGFGEATSEIEAAFKTFLLSGEIERLGIPGVPTQAAIERRSARFKRGKAKRQRPSFIDTGLYEANFIDWID